MQIVFRHLVPNVMIVIVYLTLTIPAVIRFEAFCPFWGWEYRLLISHGDYW